MRTLAFLLLLSAMPAPALAARQVTVEQAEQMLRAAHGRSDRSVARQLSGLELSERAGSAWLGRWQAEFPGSHTREALVALVDASAFLDLPPAQIANLAPPDRAAQTQMLSDTVDYVTRTIPRLPNFFAMRETTHFEDTIRIQTTQTFAANPPSRSFHPQQVSTQTESESVSEPLHLVGRWSVQVTYRDGRELEDAGTENRNTKPKSKSKPKTPDPQSATQSTSLTTSGEFGPILSLVLGDAVRGQVVWGYWEQGSAGPEAVFRYSVPQDQSHYMVAVPTGAGIDRQLPGYHGEVAVDPANGTVLRVTVISRFRAASGQAIETGILVEYGPVVIGDVTYICPVRGVALSRVTVLNSGGPDSGGKASLAPAPVETQVNDVSFTHYHLFRVHSRVLPADDGNADEQSR